MKILHVAHFFYPCLSAGGVVNASYQIAKMQAEDNSVKVISSDACKERLRFEDGRYDVDVDGIKVDYFKNISNRFKLATMLDTPLGAPFRIRRQVKGFDVVHVHEHRQTLAIIACHFARKYGIPYVIQAHGSVLPFFQKEGLKNIFDKVFGFKILHGASKVFALTEVEKEQYLKMGVEEDKIEIVPLGINVEEYSDLPEEGIFRERFNIPKDDKLIIFIGRVHEIKGLDLLIDAFKELIDSLNHSEHDVKLAIIGPDDGYMDTLNLKIAEWDIADEVIVTGPLYKREKQDALVDCDLFVMPSRYESFTTSGLEAMACGKPLVLTKNNHIHDWVDGSVGLACDDDKISLKNAMAEVLFDDELSREFGENGKRLIQEKYNWGMINEQILNIYEGIIE